MAETGKNLREWPRKIKRLGLAAALTACLFTHSYAQNSPVIEQLPPEGHASQMLEVTKIAERVLEKKGFKRVVSDGVSKGSRRFDPRNKTFTAPPTNWGVRAILANGHEALHAISYFSHDGTKRNNNEQRFVEELHAYLNSPIGAKPDKEIHSHMQTIYEKSFSNVDFQTFTQLKKAVMALYCAFGANDALTHVKVARFIGKNATGFENFLSKTRALSKKRKIALKNIQAFEEKQRKAIASSLKGR